MHSSDDLWLPENAHDGDEEMDRILSAPLRSYLQRAITDPAIVDFLRHDQPWTATCWLTLEDGWFTDSMERWEQRQPIFSPPLEMHGSLGYSPAHKKPRDFGKMTVDITADHYLILECVKSLERSHRKQIADIMISNFALNEGLHGVLSAIHESLECTDILTADHIATGRVLISSLMRLHEEIITEADAQD